MIRDALQLDYQQCARIKQAIKSFFKKLLPKMSLTYRYDNYILDLTESLYNQSLELSRLVNEIRQDQLSLVYEVKQQQLFRRDQFLSRKVDKETILYIEFREYSGSIDVAIIKMLLELGYKLDVVINPRLAFDFNVFGSFANDSLQLFVLEQLDIKYILTQSFITSYKCVFFGAFELSGEISLRVNEMIDQMPDIKCLAVTYYPWLLDAESSHKFSFLAFGQSEQKFDNLTHFLPLDLSLINKKFVKRDNKVIFTVFTGDSNYDYGCLLKAVERLNLQRQFNFVVRLLGDTPLNYPDNLAGFFDEHRYKTYDDCRQLISDSDFLVSLASQDYRSAFRYNAGWFDPMQLASLSFAKPCLVSKSLLGNFLSVQDSLSYSSSDDLVSCIEAGINMGRDDYHSLVTVLENNAHKAHIHSLLSLRQAMTDVAE